MRIRLWVCLVFLVFLVVLTVINGDRKGVNDKKDKKDKKDKTQPTTETEILEKAGNDVTENDVIDDPNEKKRKREAARERRKKRKESVGKFGQSKNSSAITTGPGESRSKMIEQGLLDTRFSPDTVLLFKELGIHIQELNEVLPDEVYRANMTGDPADWCLKCLAEDIQCQQIVNEAHIAFTQRSGFKQRRQSPGDGNNNYKTMFTSDRAKERNTLGVGEIAAVLNGVMFRTNRLDPVLTMPHTTDSTLYATEPIPCPDVPTSVLEQPDVASQTAEMQQYFTAFKNEDSALRPYKGHFKYVLCYLEGAWTINPTNIDDISNSQRSFLNADTWGELRDKDSFSSSTGRSDGLQAISFSPFSWMNLGDLDMASPLNITHAQWNYRIMCHPIERTISASDFRIEDDVTIRIMNGWTFSEYANSPFARFQINPDDTRSPSASYHTKYSTIDEIMYEIPGLNNYPDFVPDESIDSVAYDQNLEVLDCGRYHRYFNVELKGAGGSRERTRGYAGQNIFVACNTQDRIAEQCLKDSYLIDGKISTQTWCTKVSYAIPLTLALLTPLCNWNPYGLTYRGAHNSPDGWMVTDNGLRTGDTTDPDKAYNGINDKYFFQTPSEFFGPDIELTASDTTDGEVGVLDPSGTIRLVRASGLREFMSLPDDPIRQIFNIMTLSDEGSAEGKTIAALSDFYLYPEKNAQLNRDDYVSVVDSKHSIVLEKAPASSESDDVAKTFRTGYAAKTHRHKVKLTKKHAEDMEYGAYPLLTTDASPIDGHTHKIVVRVPNGRNDNAVLTVVHGDDLFNHGRYIKEI